MAIKKTPTGYEVRFRVNGRGSREHKKVFPTKAECERFQRYTIAQFETQAEVKKAQAAHVFFSKEPAHLRQSLHDERRQHLDLRYSAIVT